MARNKERHYGRWALAFGIPAAALYAVMTQVTLASLAEVSGLTPFDMRPGGYGFADAQALLNGLGEAGRSYYLTRQIPLDLLYPGLMAATIIVVFLWVARAVGWRRVAWIGSVLAVGAGLADYLENLGIVAMIARYPDVSEALVSAASLASVAKATLTTLALTLLLIVALLRGVRTLRGRALAQ